MNRRTFLTRVSGTALCSLMASSLFASTGVKQDNRTSINAQEMNCYLRSLHEVEEPSVDRIIVGDPDRGNSIIGTAWMPYWKTLRSAADHGVHLMIVHEPTFYSHWDLQAENSDFLRAPDFAKQKYLTLRTEKKQWIEDHHMTIIRCHDVLDRLTEIGIPFAFGKLLGFSDDDIIDSKMFYNVYQVKEQPASQAARYIASRLKVLGQAGVAFYGDPDYPVRSIGLGTGAISNPINYMEMEPDLFIAIDDAIRTWVQTYYAADTGQPLVVVNHGTAEDSGVELLSRHLQEVYPRMKFIHFQEGCGYKWITA